MGVMTLWVLLSFLKSDPDVLPQPWQVAEVIIEEYHSGRLWLHASATFGRVAVTFCLAMSVGFVIGLLLGTHPKLDNFFSPWIILLQNLPALVVIVLCYLWIGLNETAAILAVCINKTAMVAVTIREGSKNFSRPIFEMAKIYKMSKMARLRYIILPQLYPYLFASARNGLAIIWKIVLVVEFLGRSNGIGFQIHMYFQLFDVTRVLAYALSFVVLIGMLEYALFKPCEYFLTRWKTV